METKGVSSSILSAVRTGVANQLAAVAKRPFDGASIHIAEKQFIETIGKSGTHGLSKLFSCNDESRKAVVFNGQKHYRKYLAMGRYLTLLGEISLKRGVYQSNKAKRSICPLELKLRFINDYVSFAAAEYICYSMASMTLGEFVKHCKKWALMKPSEGTVKRVLDYVGRFLETSNFLDMIRSEEMVPEDAVTMAMSIDSTCVNIRREGWRHATAATLRARAKITSHFRWRDRVVPIWALSIPFQKDLPHLLVRHLFPFVVMFVDKRRADFQSRRSFSGTNEFQHSFVIKQRLSCPVVTNERKHTVFNRIPLRGTGRIMTNLDLKAESVAKSNLQLLFPKADSVAIAAAAISENEQSVGIRVVA